MECEFGAAMDRKAHGHDAYLIREKDHLIAVCDGISERNWDAKQTTTALDSILEGEKNISKALEQLTDQPERHATTIVIAQLVSDTRAQISWAGDSRAYGISPNSIRKLTTDHTAFERYFRPVLHPDIAKSNSHQLNLRKLNKSFLNKKPSSTFFIQLGLFLFGEKRAQIFSDKNIAWIFRHFLKWGARETDEIYDKCCAETKVVGFSPTLLSLIALSTREILTHCLLKELSGPVLEPTEVDLEEGEILLLCTDGLLKKLTEDQIATITREAPSLNNAAARLVREANRAVGSKDDMTVVLAKQKHAA